MCANSVKNKKIVIGLTGGIATGKTTVSNYLLAKGIRVIDSDKIVHELYETNKKMKNEILTLLNIDLDNVNYKQEIASKIFNNDHLRQQINQIIHPLVLKELIKQRDENQNESIVVLDIPLLFEAKMTNLVDYIFVVYLNKDMQINRLLKRNNYTKTEALSRINAQFDLEFKKDLADYVLDNNSTVEALYMQIDDAIKELLNNENSR